MASFDSRTYAHVARALKRAPSASVVSNTPTATALSESTPTPSVDVASVASIPNNVPALVAVISILAAIILGIVAWRIWAWRVRKRAQQQNGTPDEKRNSTSKGSLFGWSDDKEASRPTTLVLNPAPAASDAVWVPQVRPWAPVRRSTELVPTTITITAAPNPIVTTPPPAYLSGNSQHAKTGSLAASANDLKSTWEADTPATPHAADSLASPPPASPARTSSFAFQQAVRPAGHVRRSSSSSSAGAPARDPARLPRSMAVAQTFAPSMSDELTVAVGEKVRMIEEYADGWCLAERGSERGVVPRFCLAERERRTRTTVSRSPPATGSLNRI